MTLPLGIVASGYNVPLPVVTGGTLTSDATYYYRTFTANGTFSTTSNLTCDVLVVAGGGGGGVGRNWFQSPNYVTGGGGGGAGAFPNYQASQILNGSYAIVIGGGGAGGSNGGTFSYAKGGIGTNSSFGSFISRTPPYEQEYGTGTRSQDGMVNVNNEGTAIVYYGGLGNSGGSLGGGGGAGGNGNGTNGGYRTGGNGGAAYSVFGTSYAGGGGGSGCIDSTGAGPIVNGTAGTWGGNGGTTTGANATANRGGGGGGGYPSTSGASATAGNGGSGVVVVRYLRSAVGG